MEWKRRLLIIGIIAGVYAGCRYLFPVVLPFLLGWILASWIYPLAVKTEHKLPIIKRGTAGTLYMLLLLAIFTGILCKGVQVLLAQVKLAVASYHGLEAWGMKALNQCCHFVEGWTGIQAADTRRYLLSQAEHMQATLLADLSPSSVLGALSGLQWVVELGSAVIIIFISGILFLKDMEELTRRARNTSSLRGALRVMRRLKETVITYLKAQGVIMLIIAVLCSAGFWIMGSPYYLLFGLLLGALDALPVIGTGTFLYPAALVLVIQGKASLAIGCVLLDIVTSFAREVLEPRLLGKKLGVYPVVILAAVYIGFFIYGCTGFILGPLSLCLIYEIGKEQELW
ncbi:MAG: AI-2E family transporter [Eubacteriales bacterium]|nr:AI-2E family transporter [Eubacteriales bacterium]